jgi:hypothetical protein
VVGLILVALFFSGLTWQMISGGDPALGSSGGKSKTTTAAAASSPPTPAPDAQTQAPAVVEDDDGVVVAVPQAPPQAVQPAPSVPAPTPVQSTPS